MDQSFLNEHSDYAYICVDDVITALVAGGLMAHVEAFSFMFRLIKGTSEYAPIKIYRKPVQCLPFDDYEEVESIERDFIMTELRDSAYRGVDSCSIIDYVKRKSLIARFKAAGITLPNVLNESSTAKIENKPDQGRVSMAIKVAVVALMDEHGVPVQANPTRAASILSAIVTERGYCYSFNKDTLSNWSKDVSQFKKDQSAA